LEAGWGVVESNKGLESKVYISLGKWASYSKIQFASLDRQYHFL
jgi:hypothetical protein